MTNSSSSGEPSPVPEDPVAATTSSESPEHEPSPAQPTSSAEKTYNRNETQGILPEVPIHQISVQGSNVPTTTGWTLLEDLLTGEAELDWRNIFIVIRALWFLSFIGMAAYLFFQDNELGRLQSAEGFRGLGIKLLILLGYLIVGLMLTSLVITNIKESRGDRDR